MYDLKPAEVSRAIDVLRNVALSAADFSMKMWPDRMGSDGQPRSRGSHSLAGNALLHRLGALGYVERIGDLWTVRRISAGSPGSPAGSLAGLSPGHPPGYSPGPSAGLSPGYPPGDL